MSEHNITINLPDGSERTYKKGTTGFEIAESISSGLARAALSITVNGEIIDLDKPIESDGTIAINTWDSEDGKYTFWHSSAHILAEAVQELYPDAKFGIGPPIESGFYYDIDFGEKNITQDDLSKIENKFLEVARNKNSFVRKDISKADALSFYKENGNEYKVDLIEGLEDGSITFYTQGNFTDLCRGPHVPNTGVVKAIKLTSLAGAYWRGDNNSKQLTRIYGISFPKQKMLTEHLDMVEEAKKRDHRKLGKELGIYMIDKMVGSGLPIWLPKGTRLRRTLESFLRDEQFERGYQEVITPHIGNIELYKTSGHYPYYSDSQYDPIQVDDEEYMLKPMNCPHHHRIYSNEMRSYRDLPLRLAEFGTVYRYEQSGELSGLSRVRGFTQDDAHIYCMHEQLKQEIKHTIDLTNFVFDTFGMPVDIRLSFRDDNEEKYGGDIELWERAQKEIKEVADEMNLDYTIAPGEASFYGPKIDFIIRDAIGRKWQLGTVQVDYVMPERFDLTYVGSDNEKHRPVIIHRAPFGSMERFTSILIEHFAGNFPLWLSPEQIRVLPISDDQNDYARKCVDSFKEIGVRVTLDDRSEQIGGKIRDAETDKVPYMLIVGSKEAEAGTVSVRRHRKGDIGTFNFSDFLSTVENEIEKKSLPED
ncbi:MAG: threonine--tRNA ligase [Balneola sp.]|jgi:threonyl-tRNA synthetase|nr:threonine--tRNA ligase [Balneola sp.]MAO78089.1 threonine--tRNA ligase [Balneola sp.]MBF64090.1 threonine--tRNA ligase [Balneola sp.]|tara:strand:+ start:24905 stop:26848 length:1944 start_codon:yes stop_codon:yes gene_type:complete